MLAPHRFGTRILSVALGIAFLTSAVAPATPAPATPAPITPAPTPRPADATPSPWNAPVTTAPMTWSDTAVPTPWTTPSWTSLSPTPTPTPTEFYTSSPQDGVGGYDFSFTPGQALRRKVHFDYGKGFVVSNSTPRGNCP